jgi:hypothetical protein
LREVNNLLDERKECTGKQKLSFSAGSILNKESEIIRTCEMKFRLHRAIYKIFFVGVETIMHLY